MSQHTVNRFNIFDAPKRSTVVISIVDWRPIALIGYRIIYFIYGRPRTRALSMKGPLYNNTHSSTTRADHRRSRRTCVLLWYTANIVSSTRACTFLASPCVPPVCSVSPRFRRPSPWKRIRMTIMIYLSTARYKAISFSSRPFPLGSPRISSGIPDR